MSTVITSAPLRIGLVGGGSDLPEYYECNGHGSTVSMAINKRVYVVLQSKGDVFTERFRLNYYDTEHVEHRDSIRNDIVRATFKYLDYDMPSYVSVFSDLPSSSGLGSSSAFCVALVKAIFTLRGETIGPYDLARTAFAIERQSLGRVIGLQDIAVACYGGFALYNYASKEIIRVNPIPLDSLLVKAFIKQSRLLYLGGPRDAGMQLSRVFGNLSPQKVQYLSMLRDAADSIFDEINSPDHHPSPEDLWLRVLHKAHALKSDFSDSDADRRYSDMIQNTYKPLSFKLCGAGNGGFALLYSIGNTASLSNNSLVQFEPDPAGCNIIFSG
jgi:D-glycero-alpha-D-manno-heptose-7-phosphate kinase